MESPRLHAGGETEVVMHLAVIKHVVFGGDIFLDGKPLQRAECLRSGQQQPFLSRCSLYSVAASPGPHFQAKACSQNGMLWQGLCSVSLIFSASFKCANDCALGESEEMLLNL